MLSNINGGSGRSYSPGGTLYYGNKAVASSVDGQNHYINPSSVSYSQLQSGVAQTPSSSSGSNSSGSSSSSSASSANSYNYNDALASALAAMRQARLDAINSANAALDQQGRANEQKYNSNLTSINKDYDALRDQSEVNRYKARINQREALANRGALDSGAGRQENLIMSNNYDNALGNIQQNRQSEIDDVKNAIASMWAQINSAKASNMMSGLSDYNNSLNTLINSTYSGYSPANSNYYAAAQAALNKGADSYSTLPANSGVTTALTQDDTSNNAYSALLKAIANGYSY